MGVYNLFHQGYLGIDNAEDYKSALTEILMEALPMTSSKVDSWGVHPKEEEEGDLDEF